MLTIYRDFEQNTPFWNYARIGMPTASCFKHLGAKGRGQDASKMRERYLYEMAAELICGEPEPERYTNAFMDRGRELEAEGLNNYIARTGNEIERVAFIRRNHPRLMCGCSPDALVGSEGGVEVKTLIRWQMVKLLENPRVPPEHMQQLQGSMYVTDRKWWDIFIYCPGLAAFYERVDRNDAEISDLEQQIRMFNDELGAILVRQMGMTLELRRRQLDERLAERMQEDLVDA